MESEKVKEIKKALEDNANYEHHNKLGYIDGYKCKTVDYADMISYLGNKDGYGLHITTLKIYDKPKELSEFKRWNRTEENAPCAHTKWLYPDCKDCKACNLTRPPQSWCYVERLGE